MCCCAGSGFAFIASGMVASLSGAHYYLNGCWGNLTASRLSVDDYFLRHFRRADFLPAAFAGVADLWP
jgi:hypothetical protein